jgi:hypothetical protein
MYDEPGPLALFVLLRASRIVCIANYDEVTYCFIVIPNAAIEIFDRASHNSTGMGGCRSSLSNK